MVLLRAWENFLNLAKYFALRGFDNLLRSFVGDFLVDCLSDWVHQRLFDYSSLGSSTPDNRSFSEFVWMVDFVLSLGISTCDLKLEGVICLRCGVKYLSRKLMALLPAYWTPRLLSALRIGVVTANFVSFFYFENSYN